MSINRGLDKLGHSIMRVTNNSMGHTEYKRMLLISLVQKALSETVPGKSGP